MMQNYTAYALIFAVERWQQNLYRLKRLEGFLLSGMAATLFLLITLVLK